MEIKDKAVAFCRTACTTQNKDKANSIKWQSRELRHAAKQEGVEIVKWFENVGYSKDTLHDLFSYCYGNPAIRTVLVTDPTRLSRRYRRYLYWQRALWRIGVNIVPVHYENGFRNNKTYKLKV